jgi:hypothetical protein
MQLTIRILRSIFCYKRNILILPILFCLTIVCSCHSINGHNQGEIIENDSVKMDQNVLKAKLSDSCFLKVKGYNLTCGIMISNYYLVEDSLILDLNNDKESDYLLMLSPVGMEEPDYNCSLDNAKRLLVEVISNHGKSKIRHIYSNLLTDISGLLSPYNGMDKCQNGFEIRHMAGQRFTWDYIVQFNTSNEERIYLSKIIKECSVEGQPIKEEYFYKDYPVEKINITDTLKKDCNCYKLWEKLDKD